jgi:hypothetical protein
LKPPSGENVEAFVRIADTFDVNAGGGAAEALPLHIDGLVFVCENARQARAMRADVSAA